MREGGTGENGNGMWCGQVLGELCHLMQNSRRDCWGGERPTLLSLLGKGNGGKIQGSTGNSHQSLSQVSTFSGTTGL